MTTTCTSSSNHHDPTTMMSNMGVEDTSSTQRPLRRGDLVRVSELGERTSKRLKDRSGHLGRIVHCKPLHSTSSNGSTATEEATSSSEPPLPSGDTKTTTTTTTTTTPIMYSYDVDWVLGGTSKNVLRHELIWTNAEREGMTSAYTTHSRTKRKPMDYMTETIQKDQIKQQQKQMQRQNKTKNTAGDATTTTLTITTTNTPPTTHTTTAGKKRKLTSSGNRNTNDPPQPPSSAPVSFPSSSSSSKSPHHNNGKNHHTRNEAAVVTGTAATTTTQNGKRVKHEPQHPPQKTLNGAKEAGTVPKKRANASVQSNNNKNNNKTAINNKKGSKSSSSQSKSALNTLDTSRDPSQSIMTATTTTTTTSTTTTSSSNTRNKLLPDTGSSNTTSIQFDTGMYDRQRREFERMFLRLKTKIDIFHHFWKDNQSYMEHDMIKSVDTIATVTVTPEVNSTTMVTNDSWSHHETAAVSPITIPNHDVDGSTLITDATPNTTPVTTTPILNWEAIHQYMDEGRYILNRVRKEEMERQQLFGESFTEFSKKKKKEEEENPTMTTHRVLNTNGVHWEQFRSDVFAMCDSVLQLRRRQQQQQQQQETTNDDNGNSNTIQQSTDIDDGQKGSISYTVRKIKEAVQLAVDRTGRRHESEMKFADDRYKYTRAIESYHNTEPAMQSWRKTPYPERIYERLKSDVVCAGLSELDEKIAAYELKTSLPNSFIGQSYRYDDTGQSEAWMKSVVDETGYHAASKKSSKRRASNASSTGSVGDETQKSTEQERMAALAMAADEGVTRAQVSATMQSLLIAVQDRVMTQQNVLKQPELRSANWFANDSTTMRNTNVLNQHDDDTAPDEQMSPDLLPEIIEQPVWGIDCYTRRNIMCCLGTEFDTDTSLLFIEKWLLPAINACPENLGHNITNAARILEGLPLEEPTVDGEHSDAVVSPSSLSSKMEARTRWNESLLGRALLHKISVAGPVWLKAAANQLRCACESLGPDFFRVHPKGNGSVVLSASLKPNALVTFYRGELYPSWRWGEKMDAIDITQSRKDLKPALPDFYNMALERPQTDPRGYGLLFVDASRKAGHGSSLSHSCAPTCEVRVAACDGELCLAMTTLRELEMGEELTFDYNAVTESLNEYRSAVCLCGHGKCRGSFLHFATADCYQQVLNRNSPIASRFSSMIKGSMKQVMSPDDEQILRNHGFLTASFGAISVNRRADKIAGVDQGLVDSLDIVPVWLRTYVADVLRYIEYERRALPIALICEHLSTSTSSTKDGSDDIAVNLTAEPSKERKQASSFFYFVRSQSDFLRDLMKKEGFPETLNGLQFQHAMQKVASNYWGSLSDEQKQYWKEQAQQDFDKRHSERNQKKLADHQNGVKKKNKDPFAEDKRKVSETKRGQNKPEIQDILNSSKISFQDADAEGVVAMEQRIQQLTQTLSRVGRVLDRHREGLFESEPQNVADAEHMRKLVHAPVKVLDDNEVIHWIWNSEHGVVVPLLREVKSSRFVPPSLYQAMQMVWGEYGSFDGSNGRRRLKDALLKLRAVILKELRESSRLLRQARAQCNSQQSEEHQNPTKDLFSDIDVEENVPPAIDLSNVSVEIKKSATSSFVDVGESTPSDGAGQTTIDATMKQLHPWSEFYGERFILQAASDVLLMYAHTSNFFVFQPYLPLESTPVEVYARELGNSVPRTVVDNGISCGVQRTEVDCTEKSSTVSCADSDVCAPDDIVAKVTIRYDENYVSSQLLQWYNAGIGQKPGLPDLLGCALLPRVSDCWHSNLVNTNKKTKGEGKTKYELKVRPRLVEWMQDPYERGNPWPTEIRNAFTSETCDDIPFTPFGSPIIDFLVMGDESNIIDILYELDADDKIAAKKSSDGLLTSLDKGRPAQAVSTWVQCEDPKCMKWRKIPWFVDADLLPERFFCKDNVWNPSGNSCDAPEDDWDRDDAMVGSDGKVEGSPINKKKFEGSLPVNEESSFRIGTRFDVQRSDKSIFSIATVVKVDFSGSVKRIMFHYAKTSSDRDEWVEFGSSRIAPLFTKVPKKRVHSETKLSPKKEAMNMNKKRPKSASHTVVNGGSESESSPDKKQKCEESKITGISIQKTRCAILKVAADPLDKNSYVVGAQFDVFREDKQRHCWATVEKVDCSGSTMRVCFRFPKTKDNHREWLDFGSPYICPFKSKVYKQARKEPTEDIEQKIPKQDNIHVASDPMDEASFFIGALFDVYRKEKKRHCRATVCELDHVDGRLSGICFSYKNGDKEWMVFGSSAIFPFRSKLKKRDPKAIERKTLTDTAVESYVDSIAAVSNDNGAFIAKPEQSEIEGHASTATTTIAPHKKMQQEDPLSINNFTVGASFDVYRADKKRYCCAVVEDLDFSEQVKRIYFRFKKSKDNHVEWLDFGSWRICAYKSKTTRKNPKKNQSTDKTSKVLNGTNTISIKIDSDTGTAANKIDNWNDTIATKVPSTDENDEVIDTKTIGNTTSSNVMDNGTNGHVHQSCEPLSNHNSSSAADLPVSTLHRLPDFITPPNVSSFTLDTSRLPLQQQQQQQITDSVQNRSSLIELPVGEPAVTTEVVVSQFPVSASNTSRAESYRSGGAIPADWSGLDMLAAVTFDATATATPTSHIEATFSSANAMDTNGQVQASSSWGGDTSMNICHSRTPNSNDANNIPNNGHHHVSTWQNHHLAMPMWSQQQSQLSEQRWLPTLDSNVRMSQQQHMVMPMTVINDNYDRRNHCVLPQQAHPLTHLGWNNTAATMFNGDLMNSSNVNRGSNGNLDQRHHPTAANQFYARYE